MTKPGKWRAIALFAWVMAGGACASDGDTPSGAAGGAGGATAAASAGGTSGATGGMTGTGGTGGSAAPAADAGEGGGRGGALADGAATSDAGAPDQPPAGDAATDGGGPAASPWPPITDFAARGPMAITREMNTGPNRVYDVFRPAVLGESGRKHPIVSWANGTLFDIPDYLKLLEHWASHGFVVIAAQTNTTAGGGTHKAGIDWMLAENARAASAYFGTLDGTKIGAAGHSQGGGATIAAGANKPGPTGIVASLPLMPILSFESDKTIVSMKAAPMLNINATMDDRDPAGAIPMQMFAGAQSPLVQANFIGLHEDAMNAAMFAPTLAWFRFQLMGDEAARAWFYPPATCGLCRDPAWHEVRHKNTP